MKKLVVICGIAAFSLSGCASIMSGRTQTMTFESTPELSNITILNKAGKKVHVGQAPVTVSLKRSSGFFVPEKYTVIFEKEGYETKTVNVSAVVLNDLKKENLQANTQSLTIVYTTELPKDVLEKAKPIQLASE